MQDCPERDEFERRIDRALHELTANARHAGSMAYTTLDKQAFAVHHAQHRSLKEQIKALRESLQTHKNEHGC